MSGKKKLIIFAYRYGSRMHLRVLPTAKDSRRQSILSSRFRPIDSDIQIQ